MRAAFCFWFYFRRFPDFDSGWVVIGCAHRLLDLVYPSGITPSAILWAKPFLNVLLPGNTAEHMHSLSPESPAALGTLN